QTFTSTLLATGVRLNYVEQGDPNGPAVIMLHGFSDSSFSWSEVLPRLSPEFHVFALDQRGHGGSDRPESGYTIGDFAGDVIAFMDAVGLPMATVVGHSMGSFIAQRVASIASHRVERLVLIGSTVSRTAILTDLQAEVAELAEPLPEVFAVEFQASTIHRPLADSFFKRAVQETLKVPLRVLRETVAGWFVEERWAAPEHLTMPVLILWGDQDAFFHREDQDALLAALPLAAFTAYPETGHALHWEQPERFAADLDAFMRGAQS
ncbi:MAG: alpha/beta fold hydrolase, partial [Dehalococcoidia bacterium]